MSLNILQTCIVQAIRQNPEVATREVPEIIGHYILDNTRLNRLYQEVKRFLRQPDSFALERLTQVMKDVEGEAL